MLRGSDGAALLSVPGHPFLALRDLTAAADRALCAARRHDARIEIALARPGRGIATLELDLARGGTAIDGRPVACPPLTLLRSFVEAALDFSRLCRGRFDPRREARMESLLTSLCGRAHAGGSETVDAAVGGRSFWCLDDRFVEEQDSFGSASR